MGYVGVGVSKSCRGGVGALCRVRGGCIMQEWGGSCRVGGSCRGGWIM